MVRLVALRVLAYQTRYVGRGLVAQLRLHYEQTVELALERLLGTEKRYQPLDVVRHHPHVLPCVTLAIVVVSMARYHRIEPLAPTTVRTSSAHKTASFVEIADITARTCHKQVVIVLSHHLGSHLRYSPVVNGVLQRLSHRLRLLVGRDITE